MNYEIRITEIDAWFTACPVEGESSQELAKRMKPLEGKNYLKARLIDEEENKNLNVHSPYYTREEGSAEAFRILMLAISDTIAVREKMKKEEAAAQSK